MGPGRWWGAVGARAGAIVGDALDAALPQCCPSCAAAVRPPAFLCDRCLGRVPRLALEVCARCLARGREPVGCRAHSGFAVRPAWVYDEWASLVIQALKYDGRPDLARGLGAELARAAAPAERFDFVVEVPLHPARRRERGYNQSEELAEALSRATGVPRLPGALERVRPTVAQARLGLAGRRRNVAGAFRVPAGRRYEGRNVLLIDDVVTTGATLDECLSALGSAGARASAVTLAWAQ